MRMEGLKKEKTEAYGERIAVRGPQHPQVTGPHISGIFRAPGHCLITEYTEIQYSTVKEPFTRVSTVIFSSVSSYILILLDDKRR